ncbi:MAG: hypothetical protein AABX93_00785 [Nanoarchaeota archaeon]
MKERGGASHLGFILSFVIFITFVLFVYTTLEPTLKIRGDKQPVIDSVKNTLMENFEVNSTTITIVNASQVSSQSCIILSAIIGGASNQIDSSDSDNLKIKGYNGENFYYEVQSGDLEIGTWNPTDLAEDGFLIKLYYSDEIVKDSGDSGSSCGVTPYSIKLWKEKKQIFESKIISVMEQYESNYEQMKTDFNFPDGNEFIFSFELGDRTILEPSGIEIPSTEIYAATFPIEYLDDELNSQMGFLTIKVW